MEYNQEHVANKCHAIEKDNQKRKDKDKHIDQLTLVLDLLVLQKNIQQFRGRLTILDQKDQLEWHC